MSEHKNQGNNDTKKVKVRLTTTKSSTEKCYAKARRVVRPARTRLIVRPARELKAYIAVLGDTIILGHPS